MSIAIVCIVEGHGEEKALPLLIRRLCGNLVPMPAIHQIRVLRQNRSSLVQPGGLERALELARRQITMPGAVVVVLDADKDCPAQLGPELVLRAQRAHADLAVAIVIANREFEAWFLAAARSLRGVRGLSADLEPPLDPENVRGAKEWLSRHMSGVYSPVVDQVKLAAKMDLDAARAAPSFDKFVRELNKIAHHLEPFT